jgi:hypothetical protein
MLLSSDSSATTAHDSKRSHWVIHRDLLRRWRGIRRSRYLEGGKPLDDRRKRGIRTQQAMACPRSRRPLQLFQCSLRFRLMLMRHSRSPSIPRAQKHAASAARMASDGLSVVMLGAGRAAGHDSPAARLGPYSTGWLFDGARERPSASQGHCWPALEAPI